MPKYLLNAGYELCGWEGLPFGLRYPNNMDVDFFDRESYVPVLYCDGQHELTPDALTDKQRQVLEKLLQTGACSECADGARLEPYQEYRQYGCMFKTEAQWSITGRCNYRCKHCFMSAPQGLLGQPTFEDCLKVIKGLSECGVRMVGITGGEPLVNPDLFRILDAMKQYNLSVNAFYTNGALLTNEVLDEFAKREMYPSVQLSYDGVGWHDWLRGIDGAEQAVLKAFELLNRRHVPWNAAMCLHRHNIGTIMDSVKLLSELGCRGLKTNIATPTGNWASHPEHFINQDEAYEAFTRIIPEYMDAGAPIPLQLDGMFRCNNNKLTIPFARFSGNPECEAFSACGAMKRSLYIGPDGYVLPCMNMAGSGMETAYPNAFTTPMREILSASGYCEACRVNVGSVVTANGQCAVCAYRDICGGGCRAAGCLNHGSINGIDDACCAFFRHGWFEKAKAIIEKYKK